MMKNMQILNHVNVNTFYNMVFKAIEEIQEKGLRAEVQYSTCVLKSSTREGILQEVHYSALVFGREIKK